MIIKSNRGITNWTCNFQCIEPFSWSVEQGKITLPFYAISWTWTLKLGVSTGRSGSGLCPTRDRPVGLRWRTFWPAADRRESRIGAVGFSPETRSVRSKPSTVKNPAKIVDYRPKCARAGGDLTGSGEISLDPVRFPPDLAEISLDLVRFPPDLAHFRLKLTILAEFFTVDGFDRIDRVSGTKPTTSIQLPC